MLTVLSESTIWSLSTLLTELTVSTPSNIVRPFRTNVPKPLRTSSMTSSPSLIPELLSSHLYYRLISVIDSSTRPCLTIDPTLSHNRLDLISIIDSISLSLDVIFTIDSTLSSTRPYLHLCSEPMDFTYYSIRRRDMPHGGERVELMIDG